MNKYNFHTEYYNALNLLGLNEDYTEEDLKKAYHQLAIKYHPDYNHTSEALEKMKQINNANNILKYALDNGKPKRTYNSYHPYQNMHTHYNYNNKKNNTQNHNIISQIKVYQITKDDIKNYQEYFKKYINKINICVANTCKYSSFLSFNDDQLIIQYMLFKRMIIGIYNELVNAFCYENYINYDHIYQVINFDLLPIQFFNELDKLKIYSQYNNLKEKLDNILLEYSRYDGYDNLKNVINLLYSDAISKNNFRNNKCNTSNITENFKLDINKIFNQYYDLYLYLTTIQTFFDITKNDNFSKAYELRKIINIDKYLDKNKFIYCFKDANDFQQLFKNTDDWITLINNYEKKEKDNLEVEKYKINDEITLELVKKRNKNSVEKG